jgi:hypothetical protein
MKKESAQIPGEVTGFLTCREPATRTTALPSTQPLTKVSTNNVTKIVPLSP